MAGGAHTIMGAAEQTLYQTHSVCFNSFRMRRICGSSLLIAGYLGVVEEAVLFSPSLIKKMLKEPQVCGIGWDGVGSSF